MTKPQIKIVDCTTGEEIVRDAFKDEITQIEKDHEDNQDRKLAETEMKIQNELARQAILDRIGLTADEVKLLFG